ncbi:hypothetical protein RJ640_015163 [Escallonia rubra]|uniref:Uncharacterized protein n=1 Tax=Escallonia rubra TaxID=112253 RepID=A0AA88UQB7_9ASTE|nr:hypothetical protein RJ640_015163 [Escallonia rubra]
MYCKCGDMGSGRKVFYGSMERNAISWTALMSGYVSNGRLEQALRSSEQLLLLLSFFSAKADLSQQEDVTI